MRIHFEITPDFISLRLFECLENRAFRTSGLSRSSSEYPGRVVGEIVNCNKGILLDKVDSSGVPQSARSQ